MVNDPILEHHLAIQKYGDFELTGAVAPAMLIGIPPTQGYKFETYTEHDASVPVIIAAVSKEHLLDAFVDLVDLLPEYLSVALQTSMHHDQDSPVDLMRIGIDKPVLMSTIFEYEDLLLKDGASGIAVFCEKTKQEIQFDEHKLLIVYGEDQPKYTRIFHRYDVEHVDDLRLITDAEHFHTSSDEFCEQFQNLKRDLGVEDEWT